MLLRGPCLALSGGRVVQSAGPYVPGTIANGGEGADPSWIDTANVAASDDSKATVTIASGQTSQSLRCTNFGASIPATATIVGVQVAVERSASDADSVSDGAIQLIIGGSPTGDDKDAAGAWPTSDATATYGGSGDLWGLAITQAQAVAADFGVSIKATGTAGLPTARIDLVQITVYYTA